MGWSVGFDSKWNRDIGYGVPSICDHPGCKTRIDRGLSYICGNEQPYGGDTGCGLFFCSEHRVGGICKRCAKGKEPYIPKPDTDGWVLHKLTDPSWEHWRALNGVTSELPKRVLEGLRGRGCSAILGLTAIARAAYLLCEDTMDSGGDFVRVDRGAFQALSDMLDFLDDYLPDDKPGEALNPADKAVWSLQLTLEPLVQYAGYYKVVREAHWASSPFCVVLDPKKNLRLGALCPSGDHLDQVIENHMESKDAN